MKIPTVIVFNDNINSPCAFWRSQNPLSELAKQGHINLVIGNYGEENWPTLRNCDIAFFQRPMSKHCLNQVFTAKDLGLRIIIDLDDHNKISPSHEVYNLWCDEYDELSFSKIMMVADIVFTSTKNLQNYYLRYSNNVILIPNAINDYWLSFNKFSLNKTIFLRAGNHHLPDIWKYKESIIKAMAEHIDWHLYVMGGEVKFLADEIKNYQYLGNFNIHQYFGLIIQANPGMFIVPLEDNELNRGKSNISWLESTLAGGACLTPNFWNLHKYSATYKDSRSFYENMSKLMDDISLRQSYHTESKKKIYKDYLLSNVNKQRLEIINKLTYEDTDSLRYI